MIRKDVMILFIEVHIDKLYKEANDIPNKDSVTKDLIMQKYYAIMEMQNLITTVKNLPD